MTELSVSVVVVSYDRPDDLELCLKALALQYHRNFEIVVVHNAGSHAGLLASGLADEVKSHCFELPNISAARNLGINKASGDIVAFIDDDAIAEPTWLFRLLEPFSDTDVVAAGGLVVGRNGFDVQWGGEVVNSYGESTKLDVLETTIIEPKSDHYGKTHGTNCAFRRETLRKFHGFDENYHFYLDETDLNIRLGKANKNVAFVPSAEVHHRFSKSHHRKRTRAPKSLFDIGASTAYFLKKHSLTRDYLVLVRQIQQQRLRSFVVSGCLEPRDIQRLMRTFEEGALQGAGRLNIETRIEPRASQEFFTFRPYLGPNLTEYLSCRRLFSSATRLRATQLAASGSVITLFVFSWTSLRHRRQFHSDGYWVQSGGLFGKSERSQKGFRLHSLASRTRAETADLVGKRGPEKTNEGCD